MSSRPGASSYPMRPTCSFNRLTLRADCCSGGLHNVRAEFRGEQSWLAGGQRAACDEGLRITWLFWLLEALLPHSNKAVGCGSTQRQRLGCSGIQTANLWLLSSFKLLTMAGFLLITIQRYAHQVRKMMEKHFLGLKIRFRAKINQRHRRAVSSSDFG